MARRVFVHVGCPKTGTSYLQSVLWHNKQLLRDSGLLVPLAFRHHYGSALTIRDALDRPNGEQLRLAAQQLIRRVRAYDGDAVVSHELMAPASAAQVDAFLDRLAPAEVHVVITARDLARQLPAEWQQSVKSGSRGTLRRYVERVRNREHTWFWSVQDVPDIARRWGGRLPPDRVHVVTVPPQGAAPGVLWHRFASVLGIDPAACSLDVYRANESLGVVEVELLRRVNPLRSDHLERQDYDWLKRRLSNETLAQRDDARPFGYDPSFHPWVVEAGKAMVDELRSSKVDVVGDLDDLLPPAEPRSGVDPATVTTDELLAVALETLLQSMAHRRTLERELKQERRGT